MREQKRQTRWTLRRRLERLSPEEVLAHSAAIRARLLQMSVVREARRVLLYASMPGEVRTDELLVEWWKDREVFLPRVSDDGSDLEIYRVRTPSELVTSRYGIREPMPEVCRRADLAEVSMILVPGLGFDPEGWRIGRGKGYYDRLLGRPGAAHIPKVGLFFECQLLEMLPAEIHDSRLDYAVTETEIFKFDTGRGA